MRAFLIKNIKHILRRKAAILMYHRIAAPPSDVWQIAVNPDNFEGHLKVLKKDFIVITLDELVSNLLAGKIRRNSVAITFDDGYVDNFTNAKPLLEKYQLPATFFIASGNLGKQKEFWWDELEKVVIDTNKLPETLQIEFNNELCYFQMHNESIIDVNQVQKHQFWNACDEHPPTVRSKVFYDLWEKLKLLPIKEQEKKLSEIRAWAGINASARNNFMSMSEDQLGVMAGNDLFQIGAHTVNHPALAHHAIDYQLNELSENKRYLEDITGTEINNLAFPYGNYNEETIRAAKQLGFRAAFTTSEKPVFNTSNPFTLSRYQVRNWDKNTFKEKLKFWLY